MLSPPPVNPVAGFTAIVMPIDAVHRRSGSQWLMLVEGTRSWRGLASMARFSARCFTTPRCVAWSSAVRVVTVRSRPSLLLVAVF